MLNSPDFSIIITAHSVDLVFFEECLASVLRQTFSNWECLILCDDFSVSKNQLPDDPRIVFLTIASCSPGAARNVGITKAKGKFLVFLDCDDCLNVHFLETGWTLVSKGSWPIVIFGFSSSYNELSSGPISEDSFTLQGGALLEAFLSTFALPPQESHYPCCNHSVWAKIFNKSWVDNNHLHFEDIFTGEDTCFLLSAVVAAKTVLIDPSFISYFYRINNNSLTFSAKKNFGEINLLFSRYYSIINVPDVPPKYLDGLKTRLIDTIFFWLGSVTYGRKRGNAHQLVLFKLKEAFPKDGFAYHLISSKTTTSGKRRRLFAWLLKHRLFFLVSFLLGY
jgi:glycosyltransferase involved in cell wall biosynthesis